MKHVYLAAIAAFALAGCVSAIPALKPDTQQDLADAERRVTCTNEVECDAKWTAARTWARARSVGILRLDTSGMIQTRSIYGSSTPEYIVFKDVGGIVLQVICGAPLGCDPSEVAAKASFVRAIQDGAS